MHRFFVALIVGLVLAAVPAADGAYFIAQPPTYVQSGAGPFEWQMRSSDPTGSHGSFAYKLSTESVWHRCGKDSPPRLSGLAEGVYTITIADDINLNWYSARGLAFSGATQPCWDSPTTSPPSMTPTVASLYVDSTPPTVSIPNVIVAGLDSLVSVEVNDAVSGVEKIEWRAGDGFVTSGTTFMRHAYVLAGSWPGSVTVTDRAGNQTRRDFTAVVAPPSTPAPSPPSPTPRADVTAPQIQVASKPRLLSGSVAVAVGCSEKCIATPSATLKLAGRQHSLRGSAVTLTAAQRGTLVLPLGTRARRDVRAARRKNRRVTVSVAVTAVDDAGNRGSRTIRATFR